MTRTGVRVEREIGFGGYRAGVGRSIGIYIRNGYRGNFTVFQAHRRAKRVNANHGAAQTLRLAQRSEGLLRLR